MKLGFLGGAGCVTGSRTLVQSGRTNLLVDCGMFQGYKQLRLLNWQAFPFPPSRIHAVALTHAHLDHSGWLPRLLREGFAGTVHCTPATYDLAKILLEDAARLQASEAQQANRGHYSKHRPARPLFTAAEAKGVLRRFKPSPAGAWVPVGDLQVRFTPNGHILGSAMVEVKGDETILFSGDLGRPDDAVMPAPAPRPRCDRLVLESTYGDRRHPPEDPVQALRAIVATVRRRKGVLVIPSFAVGRSQALILHLDEALRSLRDPPPVYLDSPMSAKALATMTKRIGLTRVDARRWQAATRRVQVIEDAEASSALHERRPPFIVISSSGMATGGRVLGHLARFAPDPRNAILLAGHQAGGTRGASLAAGASTLRIQGRDVPIRATVRRLGNVSAHADQGEILAWLASNGDAPAATYLNHGEPASADALRREIMGVLGWPVHVPRMGDSFAA